MKFKVKVQVGVNFPGMGLTKKNKEFEIEADSIESAMSAAAAKYREIYKQEPSEFASWQVSLSLHTSEEPAAPAAE